MTRPALPQAFLDGPIAHRALHDRSAGRIENALRSVRAAIAAGLAIEIDLQLSADGEAMVFHDATLDRLTWSKGPVHRIPAAVLQGLYLRDSRDTIQTLPQILKEVRGRVPILIELKDQSPRDTGQLERATAMALTRYKGPVAVMSFNPRMVARMAKMAPDIPRGLTTGTFAGEDLPEAVLAHLRQITDFDAVGASFISHEAADLSSPRVAQIKAAGYPVLTWTIKTPEAEAMARTVADQITFEGYHPASA